MTSLKYLSFQHIKGFNDLSDASKDLFIELYKQHLARVDDKQRADFSESNIQAIKINKSKNFITIFNNGKRITYTTNDTPVTERFKTSRANISALQHTIQQINAKKVSSDIIDILFRMIYILSNSQDHNKEIKTELIQKASKIGSELSLVQRILDNDSFNEDILTPVLNDAIFFMNRIVLTDYNGRIAYSPEYEDSISEVITLFEDYLVANEFLVKTFRSRY